MSLGRADRAQPAVDQAGAENVGGQLGVLRVVGQSAAHLNRPPACPHGGGEIGQPLAAGGPDHDGASFDGVQLQRVDGQPPQIQDTQQPVHGNEFPGEAAVAQLLGQARGVGHGDGAQQVGGG